jgi:hypothetical protein
MKWSDLPRNPSATTLRQFAFIWLVFFLGLGCWQGLIRGRSELGVALAIAAVLIGLLGLAKPAAIRWLFVGWMVAVFPIGWVVSQLMLAMLFYGIFTPIGVFFRMVGRDALRRKFPLRTETYWSPKTQPTDIRRYFKQF